MPAPKAPPPDVPKDKLAAVNEWRIAAQAAVKAIELERKLRQELVASLFPEVKEGVRKAALPAGWLLEIDQKFNRTLDQAALPTAIAEMRELEITKLGVTTESLFKYTADIVISPMREIEKAVAREEDKEGPAHKIYAVLASVLTTKPGLPSVKLLPPKEDK